MYYRSTNVCYVCRYTCHSRYVCARCFVDLQIDVLLMDNLSFHILSFGTSKCIAKRKAAEKAFCVIGWFYGWETWRPVVTTPTLIFPVLSVCFIQKQLFIFSFGSVHTHKGFGRTLLLWCPILFYHVSFCVLPMSCLVSEFSRWQLPLMYCIYYRFYIVSC